MTFSQGSMVKPTNTLNRRVLACRPQQQNATWVVFLQEQGLDVLDIPLLQIADIETAANKQAVKEIILKLDAFDYLIFVSQNAVRHAFEWIDDFWPELPEQQLMFAIGSKTAAAIADICKNYYPSSSINLVANQTAMNSEALLEHELMRAPEGKKILIFKGAGGRKFLEQNLRSRGAEVSTCSLYERSLPDEAVDSFTNLELDKARDIFVVFSGETLNNLDTALEGNAYPDKKTIPLVVPGERVAELAKNLGFENIHTAENASETSMWHTLASLSSLKND